MLRGEFVRADGLVIPNNVTQAGAQMILAAALTNQDVEFWAGLVYGSPDPALTIQDLVEPTIGTNGYARIQVARSSVGWPTSGTLNGQPWFETDWLTWAATGGDFDQTVRRVMICGDETATNGDVFALSTPLPADLIVTPTTDEVDRRFKYRLYGG